MLNSQLADSTSEYRRGGEVELATTGALARARDVATRPLLLSRILRWLPLFAVLAVASAFTFYGFDRASLPNQYYAATVLSMLQSWHAFIFASFDSAGFVTVDKPPMGFWIQALSAKLLGFSAQSVLLPQALAFVAAVGVTYWLVRRAFGTSAGVIAGLAMAVMPISVAVSRNNTIDSLVVIAVLLAAWAALVAAETGRLRWLILSTTLIGLGFEIKMLQAYLVAPAIYVTYLVGAPIKWWMRLVHLTLASIVVLVVSLAWPLAVDMTPADQRPYVGSTQDNSALSLAIGYNGLQRLLGRDGVLGATARGGQGNNGGPGGNGENGQPGPLRLFNQQLAGQISWLLPLALLGLSLSAPSLWRHRNRLCQDRRSLLAILFGIWLLTCAGFFSTAEFWHTYYLVMLAPPVAGLAAMSVFWLWRMVRQSRWMAWTLPLALLGVAGFQVLLIARHPGYSDWLSRGIVAAALASAIVLGIARLCSAPVMRKGVAARVARMAAGVGMLALLAAPTVWAGTSVVSGVARGPLPVAGPAQQRGPFGDGNGPGPNFTGAPGVAQPARGGGSRQPGRDAPDVAGGPAMGGGPGRDGGGVNQSALISFLQEHRGDARYLLATGSAGSASPIILATSQPVMALGGFSGGDPILDSAEFAGRVNAGDVRYVLLGGGFGGQGRGGLTRWVQSSCTQVPPEWVGGTGQLYDCSPLSGVAG